MWHYALVPPIQMHPSNTLLDTPIVHAWRSVCSWAELCATGRPSLSSKCTTVYCRTVLHQTMTQASTLFARIFFKQPQSGERSCMHKCQQTVKLVDVYCHKIPGVYLLYLYYGHLHGSHWPEVWFPNSFAGHVSTQTPLDS